MHINPSIVSMQSVSYDYTKHRSFLRQWPFNSWLASRSSEIQTGAFVTKCSGLQCFPPDNSIVHIACSSRVFTSVQSWSHTMHLLYLTPWLLSVSPGSAAPAGSLWLCYCSRRFKAAKTKQAAPVTNAPPGREIPTAAR